MSTATFAVIFRGKLADGAEPAAVRANLKKLFKAGDEHIDKMFSGQPVIIKKGLDEAAAAKYRTVLGKAGAIVEIVDAAKRQAAKSAQSNEPEATAKPAAAVNEEQSAARAVDAPAGPPQTVPSAYADREAPPDAIDASMAEPGATLVEYEAPRAPDIATEHLSVAEVGATLVDAEPVPEPEFDLSGLTLDPPGTTIVEPTEVKPPEYDLSGMSLEENPA